MIERLSVRTSDNINLKGFLFKSNEKNDKCILFIPGLEGNYIECDFIDEIQDISNKLNYDFLCSHIRSSMQIFNSQPLPNEKYPTMTGSTFEKFSDCVYDISTWIDFLQQLNYKEIIIISHSYGSNKMIYFLNKIKKYNHFIKQVILLSPIDCIGRTKKRHNYDELVETAKNAVLNNNGDKLLLSGFFYQSCSSFLDFLTDPEVDNFPLFANGEKDFVFLNNITIPCCLVYGEEEKKYISIIKDLQLRNIIKPSLFIVQNANHNYIGSNGNLATTIKNILLGRGVISD